MHEVAGAPNDLHIAQDIHDLTTGKDVRTMNLTQPAQRRQRGVFTIQIV
jgi:hypothetical protein